MQYLTDLECLIELGIEAGRFPQQVLIELNTKVGDYLQQMVGLDDIAIAPHQSRQPRDCPDFLIGDCAVQLEQGVPDF